jgi:hypothetical protein
MATVSLQPIRRVRVSGSCPPSTRAIRIPSLGPVWQDWPGLFSEKKNFMLICPNCLNPFAPHHAAQRFCGRSCANVYHSRLRRLREADPEPVADTCHCGRPARNLRETQGRSMFCSVECRRAFTWSAVQDVAPLILEVRSKATAKRRDTRP